MSYIYYIAEINELIESATNDVVWFVDYSNNYKLLKPILLGEL